MESMTTFQRHIGTAEDVFWKQSKGLRYRKMSLETKSDCENVM